MGRHVVMRAPVEHAAGVALADTPKFPTVRVDDRIAAVRVLEFSAIRADLVTGYAVAIVVCDARYELAPLLEEKRDASAGTLIADRADPIWMHGARVRATFAADDDPVETVGRLNVIHLPACAVVDCATIAREP